VIFCAFLAPRFKEAFVVDNKRIRKLLISLLIVVTSVAVLAVVKPLMQKEIGIDTTDTAFPATHWVMMSLTSPGCHNAEDEAYTASFATAGQKSEAVLARLKEKLKELGGTGYFLLVLEKIRNTWASGANNYVLFMENCLRMDGIYPYLFGNHKDFMIVYHQGMYLLILVGIFISVVHGMFQRDNQERDIFVLQLVLLGAFLFYVLWETSGQYSLPFFIIMLLLAIDGYEAGMQRKTHIPYRIRLMHNHANRLIENDRGTLYKTLAVAAGVVIIMLFAFFIRNAALFTEKTDTYKAPVVNQLIANGETDYKGTEAITQTFRTKDSFNQLIFQWRNPIGENNSAQYLVTLSDAEQNVLWEQPMIAAAQGYAGAFSYDFASIVPDGEEEFILSITKTAGAEGDYLAFVKYSCGSYDPYPFGTFTIAGAVQEGDLLLQAARVEQKTYTTKKHYVIFAGVCMISFLFLEFCCILILSAIHTSNGNQMNQ
jgi:hypothetical protein